MTKCSLPLSYLKITANNLDRVNRSPLLLGKTAAKINVKSPAREIQKIFLQSSFASNLLRKSHSFKAITLQIYFFNIQMQLQKYTHKKQGNHEGTLKNRCKYKTNFLNTHIQCLQVKSPGKNVTQLHCNKRFLCYKQPYNVHLVV